MEKEFALMMLTAAGHGWTAVAQCKFRSEFWYQNMNCKGGNSEEKCSVSITRG